MTRQNNIRVALAGCGTVGRGVCEIVGPRGDALAARTGLRFDVVRALVRDVAKPRQGVDPAIITADIDDLIACKPDVVVEVMGGTTTARQVVLTALQSGIPVVTANKALLAEHGAEVYRTARENGTCVAFEASCAGGLPIVGALLHGLLGNRITRIAGIFNSTCNFVITQMLDAGIEFQAAVKQAQDAGYAEADPTLDVGGGDTAHKLTILASLAFGANVAFDQIPLTGIDRLSLVDLKTAQTLGYRCKLIGIGQRCDDGIMLDVRPTLVRSSHPLGPLSGTSSGVLVDGDVVGPTFYAGAGAGSLPTASAVVADMIDVAGGAAKSTFDTARMFNDQTAEPNYVSPDGVKSPFYVRFNCEPEYVDSVVAALTDAGVAVNSSQYMNAFRAVAIETQPVSLDRVREAARRTAIAGDEPVILHILSDHSDE